MEIVDILLALRLFQHFGSVFLLRFAGGSSRHTVSINHYILRNWHVSDSLGIGSNILLMLLFVIFGHFGHI